MKHQTRKNEKIVVAQEDVPLVHLFQAFGVRLCRIVPCKSQAQHCVGLMEGKHMLWFLLVLLLLLLVPWLCRQRLDCSLEQWYAAALDRLELALQ